MPQVAVIIPTIPSRHDLLLRALQSVARQSFTDYEVWVVRDGGQDDFVDLYLRWWRFTAFSPRSATNLHTEVLGRRWGALGQPGRLVAGYLTRCPLIAYLDDDNWWEPSHLEKLVEVIEGSDFAFSQILVLEGSGVPGKPGGRIVGDGQPRVGHVDASALLHRTELLSLSQWDPADGYEADGRLVERWVERGATWAFLPEVTVRYPRALVGAEGDSPEALAALGETVGASV